MLAYIYIVLDPVHTGTYTLNILLYGRTLSRTRLLSPLLCSLSCLSLLATSSLKSLSLLSLLTLLPLSPSRASSLDVECVGVEKKPPGHWPGG